MWLGAASLGSATWAGEHGLNLLTSSVVRAEEPGEGHDFAAIQAAQVRAFRAAHPAGAAARVSQGLVVLPTDTATPAQRERYAAYAAARLPRTASPQGPGRLLLLTWWVRPSRLPFGFGHADDVQILTDIATRLGPALGWSPAA